MQRIGNLLRDFIRTAITEEGMHGSLFPDVIRQGVDKLFGVLDTISITDKRVLPTKELSHGEPLSAAGTLEKMVLVAAASL